MTVCAAKARLETQQGRNHEPSPLQSQLQCGVLSAAVCMIVEGYAELHKQGEDTFFNKTDQLRLHGEMCVQIPLLPVFCHQHVHPATLLSKMLPPAADRYLRNSYVQEVTTKHPFLYTPLLHTGLKSYAIQCCTCT